MADRSLRFDLIGRDRSLSRTLDKAERKTDRFRTRLSGIGAVAGGAALAGLGILGAGALKLASEFDDAYDTIRVGTGKTGKTLDRLKDDFRGVVRDVPADFGDASTAIAELNRRTGQTGKPLQALAKRTLELTRLTGGDLTQNIASVTRLFGDWGIKTGDQAKTLDKLFRASQATGVGVDQLAQSVVKFGAPLRQLGFSFDQSIALLAKFEKEGVNSNLVMSGMRIALGKLAKAGKDPQKGFLDLAQRIKDAGSSASANRIAIEAFGQRAGPDMAAAIREGRLSIRDLQNQIANGKDTILGAARDAEDFGEKWKRVSNKLKLLAEPVVTRGLDILSTKMGELEGFLTKNLNPRLGKLKLAWDANKASILALLDPFTSVNDKAQTADQRAEQLANSLTAMAEGAGKVARFLQRIEGHLNDFNTSLQKSGHSIHVNFVRPAVGAFAQMGASFLSLNHKMIAGAATVAEALHLPQARALRKAEQNMGRFVADFKAEANALTAKAADTATRVPGGSNSRFGQSLRAAERQAAGFRQRFATAANAVATKGAEASSRVPGGSRSSFGQSLRAAERQASQFRQSFNSSIGNLVGKRITIAVKGTFQPPAGMSMRDIVFRARGGSVAGPGTSTSDSIPAMLSAGEHVLSAKEVKGLGGHAAVEQMRREARGFARGGAVEVQATFPSAKAITGGVQGVLNRIAAMIGRNVRASAKIEQALGGKANIKAFIRAVDRLPYIWGGVGPRGYDCSGLVGEVMARHKGLRSFRRYFTTASIRAGQYGLKSGLGGVLNIGVTSGSGHMAGSYGGLGFEARSTRTGIFTGAAARRPSSFARHYHLAAGGRVDQRVAALAGVPGIDIGGDEGRLRALVSRSGRTFDQGGTLAPGLNLVANRTGRPEPLAPPGPVIDERRLARYIATELAATLRDTPLAVYLDRQKVSKAVTTGQLLNQRR